MPVQYVDELYFAQQRNLKFLFVLHQQVQLQRPDLIGQPLGPLATDRALVYTLNEMELFGHSVLCLIAFYGVCYKTPWRHTMETIALKNPKNKRKNQKKMKMGITLDKNVVVVGNQ